VLWGDDNTVVADVITLMADDENLVCGNRAKGLVTVGIAECYNSGDTRGLGS
jgi:3-dehydroquinate synthase class II